LAAVVEGQVGANFDSTASAVDARSRVIAEIVQSEEAFSATVGAVANCFLGDPTGT
jgi:hypothetical protein